MRERDGGKETLPAFRARVPGQPPKYLPYPCGICLSPPLRHDGCVGAEWSPFVWPMAR